MPAKGPTRVIVETVGAGARKSVCFLDLLGWTVVAHERLRSRWPYSPPAVTLLPSVKVRIAFAAESIESESGVPMRGAGISVRMPGHQGYAGCGSPDRR